MRLTDDEIATLKRAYPHHDDMQALLKERAQLVKIAEAARGTFWLQIGLRPSHDNDHAEDRLLAALADYFDGGAR